LTGSRSTGKSVLVIHDDGRWWVADLLAQYPSTAEPGRWKVTVRYTTEPGARYQRTLWADECRAVDDPPPGWSDPRDTGGAAGARATPGGSVTRVSDIPPW
jgi:hypothetical protein